ADVSGGRCTDRSAPAGEHVHYAVVAARPGGSPSPPGLVDLDILPEPTDVTADASSDAIDITWSVPKACHSVAIEILGSDGRTDRHEAVGTTLHRFTGLETGRSYRITATARYLTVDGPRTSEPVSITATPGALLAPCTTSRSSRIRGRQATTSSRGGRQLRDSPCPCGPSPVAPHPQRAGRSAPQRRGPRVDTSSASPCEQSAPTGSRPDCPTSPDLRSSSPCSRRAPTSCPGGQ